MLAILPLFAFLCMFLILALRRRNAPIRESLLIAALIWSALVVVITETLSFGNRLTAPFLLAVWGMLVVLLLAGLVYMRRSAAISTTDKHPLNDESPSVPPEWRLWLRDWGALMLIGVCVVLLLGSFTCAVLGPPNNFDSMIYHLPRQFHWMQQGSIAHYPTQNTQHQNYMPPFAEMIGVQLMILARGDAWANLIQWFALLLSMSTASLIAAECGLNRRGQALTALLVITIPMAYIQSFNTKNDLVLSFFFLSSAWWCARLWNDRAWSHKLSILCGLSLGLGVLTKGTGIVFLPPLLVFGALGLMRRQGARAIASIATIGVVALALNLGHFSRNYQSYESPFGPKDAETVHNNQTHDWRSVVSVAVRNVVLHLSSPFSDWNEGCMDFTAWAHRRLQLDMNDPRSTFLEIPFAVQDIAGYDDSSPAPGHVLLVLLAVLAVPLLLREWHRPAWIMFGIALGAFASFCVVCKWQPWHARLHVPILCLLSVSCAGLLMSRWLLGMRWLLLVGILVIFGYAAHRCPGKTLFAKHDVFRRSRLDMLFAHRPELKEPTRQLVHLLRTLQPRSIGLAKFGWEWEYPLERMLMREFQVVPFVSYCCHEPVPKVRVSDQRHWQAPDILVALDGTQRTLEHLPTKTAYHAIAQFPKYTVYAHPEFPASACFDPGQPQFLGWEAMCGWLPMEPGLPQFQLPPFRWGQGLLTSTRFQSDGRPVEIRIEARNGERTPRKLAMKLDGRIIATWTLHHPWEQFYFHERLDLSAGDHWLEFLPEPIEGVDVNERTIMFHRIVFDTAETTPDDQRLTGR